jgi:hypothetical protein
MEFMAKKQGVMVMPADIWVKWAMATIKHSTHLITQKNSIAGKKITFFAV